MSVNEAALVDEISKLAASLTRYGLQVGRDALRNSADKVEEVGRLLTDLAERLRNDYL
jgi:hypothetical protein